MKALQIIILSVLFFEATVGAQTKRLTRPPVAPKPPISIQTATTKDGRTVLLKSDGTWEYTSDPVVTPPEPIATTPTATRAASAGSLAFEAALIFRSGDVKPMARTEFYLLDENLVKILRDAGLKTSQRHMAMGGDSDSNLLFSYGLSVKFTSLAEYAAFYSTATTAIKPHILQTATSDFTGKGSFQEVPAGSYYLMGIGTTPRGFVLWNVPIAIKAGAATSITLDQNNAAFAS